MSEVIPPAPSAPPALPSMANSHLAETILTLIQALLKTGYYTPGHPETQRARAGLYAAVQEDLQKYPELTFILVESGERCEIFLSGVQSDPLPLSSLMIKSMADLFIPKFAEYFERKTLSAFTLKSAITPREFEAFVDLMTEPPRAVDYPEETRERMTADLVRLDIVMVSTVFNVDLVGAGRKLPWRVKNILSRLKRDLNLLPLYHDLTPARTAELHNMVLGDIVRPLRNPQMLSELFLNLDLIGFDIVGIDAEQLEEMLIRLVPDERKGPVIVELARHLTEIQESFVQLQDVELLVRKEYLRGTLGRLGRAILDGGGAEVGIIRQLIDEKVLRLEDLPPELRVRLEEGQLGAAFLADPEGYLAATDRVTPEVAVQRLTAAQEQIPALVTSGQFDAVLAIFTTAARLGIDDRLPVGAEREGDLLAAVKSRLAGKKEEQIALLDLLDLLAVFGGFGSNILAELLDCEIRFIRSGVLERLPHGGPAVVPKVLAILEKRSGWYYLRNALTVLARVAPADPTVALLLRRSLRHAEPGVRKEAILGVGALPLKEAEPLLLPLLKDSQADVWQRAIGVLGKLGSVHGDYLATLQQIITAGEGRTPALLEQALKTLAQLQLPVAQRLAFEKLLSGLLEERQLFGMSQRAAALRPEVKIAGLAALGQVGSKDALPLLRRFSNEKQPAVAAAARAALLRLT